MYPLFLAIVTFLIILLFIWLGNITLKVQGTQASNAGPLEGALIGLLALMLSFSFNAEYNHFSERRRALDEETNAIRGTMARLYLLPDSIQNNFRPIIKLYLLSRVNYYRAGNNEQRILYYFNKGQIESKNIWSELRKMQNNPSLYSRSLMLIEPINYMSSTRLQRENLRQANIPDIVKIVILILICVTAFVIGNNIENLLQKIIIILSFSIMISLACFIILDLENSRTGLIKLDNSELHLEKMIQLINFGLKK